eukprot:802194-Prorocentrum_lima.AAC.1
MKRRKVSVRDKCLPDFGIGDAVAILGENASISRPSVEGGAVISGDMDDDGDYEVETTVAGKTLQGRISGRQLVPRVRVPATAVAYQPSVTNALVLADGFDRYNAEDAGCYATCVVSAPCDANGKYEVTLQSWDDLL